MNDYRTLLDTIKTNYGDNDERDDEKIFPCCLANHDWTEKEIDNPHLENVDFNWKNFWCDCKKRFPLHSVAGHKYYDCPEKIINVEYRHAPTGFLSVCFPTPRHKKVLEIGYGYGGAAKAFHDAGYEYYGIDYVSSGSPDNTYGKFIEIDKSGIPPQLMKHRFGVVYSTNVFQHLTKEQRVEYYTQTAKVLERRKGVFIFSLFTRNNRIPSEHFKPSENRGPYATNFFGVYTSVPREKDVTLELFHAGFTNVEITDKRPTDDERTNMTEFCARID